MPGPKEPGLSGLEANEADLKKDQTEREIIELVQKEIEEISESQAMEILGRVEVHGDRFKGARLTPETLKDQGLAPKYKVEIGKTTVWLSSSPYDLGRGRIAVVGYVQDKEKVIARSYYRSNSTGLWRYLPNYTTKTDGRIDWYDKGHGEESITLPVVLQHALSEISKKDSEVKVIDNPDFIFAGTARKSSRRDEGTYVQEIESRPEKLDGNFYSNDFDKKVPPKQADFSDKGQAPNFEKVIAGWAQNTSLYGEIKIEVFLSKDGNLIYMFCSDNSGRSWVGGIESNGEIQSTGLKQKWFKGGDLTTPAYEYRGQDGGYGNYDLTSDKYVDMFSNYLSRIPTIQDFLRIRHPDAFEKLQEKESQKNEQGENQLKKLSRQEFKRAVILLFEFKGAQEEGRTDKMERIKKKFGEMGLDLEAFEKHARDVYSRLGKKNKE